MTREEAIKMAKADLKCMERDTSGQDEMCNSHKCDECSLNYERGNMGEQKEWLRMAIKALEQESTGHWIIIDDCEKFIAKCSECGQIEDSRMIGKYAYCHCGARMDQEPYDVSDINDGKMSENPTGSKPEISSYYGLKSYVRERSDK